MRISVFLLLSSLLYAYLIVSEPFSASEKSITLSAQKTAEIDNIRTLNSQQEFGFNSQGAATLIAALFLISSGLLLLFYGHKLIGTMLFIVGFYCASLFAICILNTFQKNHITNFQENRDLIYILVLILAGVLGGMLCIWLEKVGFYVVGAALGFIVAGGFLQLQAVSIFFDSQVTRVSCLFIFIILGVIIVHFWKVGLLMIASSVIGSVAVFCGIDYWVESGLSVWAYRSISYSDFDELKTDAYFMLAGIFFLTLLGILQQNYGGKRKSK